MAEATQATPAGIDKEAIRAAARNLQDGPVTEGYQGDRAAVIQLLNDALATELVCVMRYQRHYHTVAGLGNGTIKAEFREHARQEQEHANWLAERIIQLNGAPDFNPATLLARSHAEYDANTDVQAMLRADLIAERVAIESYRQMIEKIGHSDPTTRHLLIKIMAVEEEHADDLRDLLA